ncbi:MAG: methionyl-tRNA formyltransferase [Candidatus Cloacimonetes bacterium 4572_55]|nr:MAG: methionyl-tRNA formyltransferase [Candidatus Cloacimonetes bacterium 4572_55]
MRIIFMGTPDFAVNTLRALIESKHDVIGSVCQPDRRKGRGRKMHAPPVKQVALEKNIPVWQPEKPNRRIFSDMLSEKQPDLIVVVAYGHILKRRILTLPRFGCVNVHASLLPGYRGAAPIQAALFSNDEKTGVTVMQMDRGMDTGDILLKRETDIDPDETGEELSERLSHLGADALMQTLDIIENGEASPVSQDHEQASYAPKIIKEDQLADWSETDRKIHDRVRAFSPKPGLGTELSDLNLRVKIVRTRRESGKIWCNIKQVAPGTILEIDKKRGILVATGSDPIRIIQVHPQNRKPIHIRDFLLGYSVKIGMVFRSLTKRIKKRNK